MDILVYKDLYDYQKQVIDLCFLDMFYENTPLDNHLIPNSFMCLLDDEDNTISLISKEEFLDLTDIDYHSYYHIGLFQDVTCKYRKTVFKLIKDNFNLFTDIKTISDFVKKHCELKSNINTLNEEYLNLFLLMDLIKTDLEKHISLEGIINVN